MIKLPVIAIVLEAWATVWRQRHLFASLALPGIIVMALVGALQSLLILNFVNDPGKAAPPENSPVGMIANMPIGFLWIVLATFAIFIALMVMYSVALHRAYLVTGQPNSPAPTVRASYTWHPRHSQFLIAFAKLILLTIPLIIAAAVPASFIGGLLAVAIGAADAPGGPQLIVVFVLSQLIIWAVVGWFWSRFSMLFPAAAVDRPLSLRDAWQMGAGNGWQLFGVLGLLTVTAVAIGFPVQYLMRLVALEGGLVGSLTASLLFSLVMECVTFVWITVSVIALSIAYQLLNPPGGRHGVTPRGGGRGW
jgi:hypothetical protein